MPVQNNEPLIHDGNAHLFFDPVRCGTIPRDYNVQPPEVFASPDEMVLIDPSEYDARIEEKERTKSRMSDLRLGISSLQQGSYGYCWSHSTTQAMHILRLRMGQPFVPLSAFSVAAIIKKGRNEGGWCGLSAQFARDTGVASQRVWPQGDANPSRFNDAAVKEDMARHKITEDWVDLRKQVWDRNLTMKQIFTCLLLNVPLALDFEWWGHSVCGLDMVKIERGSYGIRIWNSWGDEWGDHGMGVLQGDKIIPMGAIAVRMTVPSVN
jgi:hypothetical protein